MVFIVGLPLSDCYDTILVIILKQYLRVFINYHQDDWKQLLPLAEFAYNNTQHSATSVTPFFAIKGIHLRLEVFLESVPSESAHEMATDMKDLHQYLCDHRHLGPLPIVEMVTSCVARLGLPLTLQHIHPVFHVSLLQLTDPSSIPDWSDDPPPPLEVDDSAEYEVYRIMDSRINRHRKSLGLLYLIEWSGFNNMADATSWDHEENVWNAPDLIKAFHSAYPDKPRPV